jgi:hypothetical protein
VSIGIHALAITTGGRACEGVKSPDQQ